jgi:two-component sensor histidine kinase
MRVLKKSSFSDPDPIVELLRHHVELDPETEEFLRICINEVVQNVEDHAASPIGAVAAARYMRTSNEIRIAIVDRGMGIETTVRGRHPEIPDTRQAIARVMQGGISAKSRPNNMGVGISNLCAIVQLQLEGRVFIMSQDTCVNRQPRRHDHWTHLECPYPGTAVFINVPVDH